MYYIKGTTVSMAPFQSQADLFKQTHIISNAMICLKFMKKYYVAYNTYAYL